MSLPVPCNLPGTVKQITPKGTLSEVILALDNPTMEITVLLSTTAAADLNLRKNDPVQAVIMKLEGALLPGTGEEVFTVKSKGGAWVTIKRGPATAAQIEADRKNNPNPTKYQELVWSMGFRFIDEYDTRIHDVLQNMGGCESENYHYQIESILDSDNFWKTIPYGRVCQAKIQSVMETYNNSPSVPTGDREAWLHGYASHKALEDAFAPPNYYFIRGPTLAGFVYNGRNDHLEPFTSSGLYSDERKKEMVWSVPVNLYRDLEKIGVANFKSFEAKLGRKK
jgi:hypothetical protein